MIDVLGIYAFKVEISDLGAAKLMGILQALLVALCKGWPCVCCECDAKVVVQSLNNPNSSFLARQLYLLISLSMCSSAGSPELVISYAANMFALGSFKHDHIFFVEL